MLIEILSAGVLISATLAIVFKQHNRIKMYAVFKPLTTILILVIAVIVYLKIRTIYSAVIIAALVFCLAGDIFLINKKYFIYGLSSFAIAQIGFTIAFSGLYGFSLKATPLIILIVFTGIYFNYLRKYLNRYLIPVFIYLAILIVMSWQATGLIYVNNSLPAFGVAAASVLFILSDSVIAFNKFKKPFRIAEILILSSYWTAIYIFAISGLYLPEH